MLYLPETAVITRVVPQTGRETLFEIELTKRKTLGHKPGQFVEVSIFGVGEAPISISSAPVAARPTFEICVRKVGNVTNALLNMNAGDKIGIRGPFGNGFELNNFLGKPVLFVAAGLGIVPLRSFIQAVLANRKEYGQVFILYGCRTPQEFLFAEEVATWAKRKDIEFHSTVDIGDEEWTGNVGVITTLISKVDFDSYKTQAAIVGPPVMYRFVIKELRQRRMPEGNIWMSLERKMKCGVGKCGHCQMNNIYICQDGPVFNYAQARGLPEAI